MWILESRFSEDFGRREFRKMDVVSDNKNETVDIAINDVDIIREKIMDKLSLVGEQN